MRRLGVEDAVTPGIIAGALAAAVCLLSQVVPRPGPEATGPQTLLPTVYTVLLSFLILSIGLGLGRLALRSAGLISSLDPLEAVVFSFAVGIGLVGLGVYLRLRRTPTRRRYRLRIEGQLPDPPGL
jgi:hypothetical protein